jgi:dihydroorotate dehydrogenase
MKPWLALPSPIAHAMTPYGLPLFSRLYCRLKGCPPATYRPFKWNGLHFQNRFGPAGGVDKNAENILDWQRLGAGFLEVGTVTPEGQGPNPGRILARENAHQALWNKMGFPNQGALRIFRRIEKQQDKIKVPLFINVGKNRTTPPDKAAKDYARVIQCFKDIADVFVVNISSPNTQGLRHLQAGQVLAEFLEALKEELSQEKTFTIKQPLLLNLSPDMEPDDFQESVQIASQFVQGFICTNTTSSRDQAPFFPSEGGMSGKPLASRSEFFLKKCIETLGSSRAEYLIMSCGGVIHPFDAHRRLEMGADLVQTYSGLIFYGPCFFQDCCKLAKVV